jgi:transposase
LASRDPGRIHEVVLLAQQGMSVRAIARALHVGRNSVRAILATWKAQREGPTPPLALPPPPASRPSKLDAHARFVEALLQRYPDITAQRVFEELKARTSFDGSYTIVKEHVREARPRPAATPSTPVEESPPGERAESDWASVMVTFTNGSARRFQFFGYTLAYSNRKYHEVFDSADLHALMDGHVGAFAYFGGLAHTCKYDGQKPVVLRYEGPQAILNPRFIAFATHYGFRPIACRPRHPNDKPHAELAVRDLRNSFFNGRSFRDLADLRAQLES